MRSSNVVLWLMAGLTGASVLAFAALVLSGDRSPAASQPGRVDMPGLGVRAESYDPAGRPAASDPEPTRDARRAAAAPPPDNFLALLETPPPPLRDDPRRGRPSDAGEAGPVDDLNRIEADEIAAVAPQVLADARASLGDNHTRLRNQCWKGGVAAKLQIEASFDSDGKLLATSILGDRQSPDVAACVGAQALGLAVQPPGKPVTVQVPLEFP